MRMKTIQRKGSGGAGAGVEVGEDWGGLDAGDDGLSKHLSFDSVEGVFVSQVH